MPLRLFRGQEADAPDITYSFYPVYAGLFGAEYAPVPLRGDFTVDVPGLMQGGPIALANPNAPTGILLGQAEIRALAEHARAGDAVLLVDEVYAAFAPETSIGLLREFDNVLIVRTFCKSHALAGMRVGYAMGSPRLMRALRRVRERLMAAGIDVLPSATNFLFVRADEEDAAPVQLALREEEILVRHFTAPRLKPWLRVTVGTAEDMETVTEALIRLIKIV